MNVHFKSVDQKIADKVFGEQKERILKAIPNAEVHHIGSTAIPSSITKGDLDVNVRVKKEDFIFAVEQLKKLYEVNQLENWTDNFASFKDDKNLKIDFGVQLTAIDSDSDDFLKIRNLLISRPDLTKKFNEMKTEFEGKDMKDYRKAKSDFFEELRKNFL